MRMFSRGCACIALNTCADRSLRLPNYPCLTPPLLPCALRLVLPWGLSISTRAGTAENQAVVAIAELGRLMQREIGGVKQQLYALQAHVGLAPGSVRAGHGTPLSAGCAASGGPVDPYDVKPADVASRRRKQRVRSTGSGMSPLLEA